MKPSAHTGFTLIELMIVVAIIGILAAIAIPKFASLIRQSSEGTTKGNLGSLRSALSIYYGDLEGIYPVQLSALTVNGKYLASIPSVKTPSYHPDTSAECDSAICPSGDDGKWFYNSTPTGINFGTVVINCTHTDTKGTVWTSY